MIELPTKYKQNTINRFGQNGIEWLNSVDTILEKYIKKFHLHSIKLAPKLTVNIILFATSDDYGDIVIKIGSPSRTTLSEIDYMQLSSSKYFAKCYYFNKKDRILILEKLSPGYFLTHLENQEERIDVFCDILNHTIMKDIPKNSNFTTYETQLKEIINLAYSDKQKYASIFPMIDFAKKFYDEIKNKNLPQYLLHNDLHHKNILKSNSTWKSIDPHGLIGEKVFETVQFIRSELEYTNLNKLDKIITLISNNLKEDKILIYKALYITIFLKISFYIKSKYDTDIINYNIQTCKKVYEYIKSYNAL